MINNFKIKHVRTATLSPQANASERVNQPILAGIRAYLEENHCEWDKYLSKIECALRPSVHTLIGVTPSFALFGMNMVTHGCFYKIARALKALSDAQTEIVPKSTRRELLCKQNLHQAYERNKKTYNVRSKITKFIPGQEVYRRNFQHSDFKNNFNAKFASKFLKCRILRPVGNSLYEVEDLK